MGSKYKGKQGKDREKLIRSKNGFKDNCENAYCYLDLNGDGIDDIFINPTYGSDKQKVHGEMYINRNGDLFILLISLIRIKFHHFNVPGRFLLVIITKKGSQTSLFLPPG